MAKFPEASIDTSASNSKAIYAYLFDDDKIQGSPKTIKQICTSDCIFDGTYEALQKIHKKNGECYVLLLCYTNSKFDNKCDPAVKSTDTQIGCITSTLRGNILKYNNPSHLMKSACADKVGKFAFKEPPSIMHYTDFNCVIASDVKNMVQRREIIFLQSHTRQRTYNEPMSPTHNIDILRSRSSSGPDSSPKSVTGLEKQTNASLSNSPPPGLGFDELSKDITKFDNKRKQKATSIIYGDLQDMQTFLYNCAGNRPLKQQREITKLHVVPISVLLSFIKNSSSNGYQNTNVWRLPLFNEWVKED